MFSGEVGHPPGQLSAGCLLNEGEAIAFDQDNLIAGHAQADFHFRAHRHQPSILPQLAREGVAEGLAVPSAGRLGKALAHHDYRFDE